MRIVSPLALILAVSAVAAQETGSPTLSLQEAIRLALERNGNVAASALERTAAKARLLQTQASFFPTVTPQYSYTDSVANQFGSAGSFSGVTYRETTVDVRAEWLLFDSGQRLTSFRQAEANLRAARHDDRQYRRGIIYDVTAQYYEALRGQELLRVADAAVQRAKGVLEITKAQAEAGLIAAKETLQAEADLANAEVQRIQADLQRRVADTGLRVIIAWPETEPMPELEHPAEPAPSEALDPLSVYQERGLARRPDLMSAEENITILNEALKQADMDARVNYEVTASYSRRFEVDMGDQRRLSLYAMIPLFDAGRSREVRREARLSRDAAKERFTQQEKQVRAEIESAYLTYTLRSQSLTAASKALGAAELNYEAAVESRRLGAASLSEVIDAELALVTAETNLVQAIYDFYIGEVELTYVVGDPMAGELP
jgi:outer membrane protein